MKKNISKKDDFYLYINSEFLFKEKIEDGMLVNSIFESMKNNINKDILSLICNEKDSDKEMDQIRFFYRCLEREYDDGKNDQSKLKKIIDKIESQNCIEEISLLASSTFIDFDLIQVYIESDIFDNEKKSIFLIAPEDKLDNTVFNSEKIQNVFKEILVDIGFDEKKAEGKIENVIYLESSMKKYKVESDKIDKFTINEFKKYYKFDFLNFIFDNEKFKSLDILVVGGIAWLNYLLKIYNDSYLKILKDYIEISTINSYLKYLGGKIRVLYNDLQIDLYGDTVQKKNMWILDRTCEFFSIPISKLYADKKWNNRKIIKVQKLTNEIIKCYQLNLKNVEWLSQEQKKKIDLKLEYIKSNIGCANNSTFFNKLDLINNNSFESVLQNIKLVKDYLYENILNVPSAYCELSFSVNTSYDYSNNIISIPLGLINEMVDEDNQYEEDLAGIGFLIAHEIAHSFDKEGLKYDENGNYKGNFKFIQNYKTLYSKFISFYCQIKDNTYTKIDYERMYNENFADICAIKCMMDLLGKKKYSDYRVFFETYVSNWKIIYREEYLKKMLKYDVHPIYRIRVNACLMNCDEFYSTYNITENDGMYIKKEKRLNIW